MKRILMFLVFANSAMGIDFSMAGELIYLRPSFDTPYTVIETPNFMIGSDTPVFGLREGPLKPGYAPGYHLELNGNFSDYFVTLSWTSWIHSNRFSTSVGPDRFLWLIDQLPAHGNPLVSTVSRHDGYRVQFLDAKLTWCEWALIRKLFASAEVGLRYTFLRHSTILDADITPRGPQRDRWSSGVQGIGPRLALRARYTLPWALEYRTCFGGTLHIGAAKGRLTQMPASLPSVIFLSIRTPSRSIAFLSGDLRFSLGRSWLLFRQCILDTEIGYLIHYISHGTQRTAFIGGSNAKGISTTTLQAFALDGFNFRLSIRY